VTRRRARVPGSRRPATIVDWIEAHPSVKPAGLSEPTKTWVDRMWHALIQVDTSDASFEDVDAAFIAYLDRIDEREAELANAMFMFLSGLVEDHYDELPKCGCCGRILCPHCGSHTERTPAA
jgi:hypothetical protein